MIELFGWLFAVAVAAFIIWATDPKHTDADYDNPDYWD